MHLYSTLEGCKGTQTFAINSSCFPPRVAPTPLASEALPWGLKSGNLLLFVLHFPKQRGLEGVLWEAGIPRPPCRELDIPARRYPEENPAASSAPAALWHFAPFGEFFSGSSALVSRGIWEPGRATGEGTLLKWQNQRIFG